jgi:hypothetical protein
MLSGVMSPHGLVKVDCDTAFERVIFSAATLLAVLAAILFYDALVGPRGGALNGADGHSIFVPTLMLFGAGALFATRVLIDNFYLVDPERHAVYFHFEFMFVRHVRLLLEQKDVAGVSVQARRRRTRYSGWWWEQRVVLIRATGRLLPMSNWRRDGLWDGNNAAKKLAAELGCSWHEAPDNACLAVTTKDGAVSVTFEEVSWCNSVGGLRAWF